jgi:single-strand DNA-binding protein
MSGEVSVTLTGHTAAPSELRFVPSGAAVCSFSLGVTPRRYDKQSSEWRDQPTQWYRCSVWRDQAEHVAETLTEKGMRVIVVGTMNPREYEKDGVKRLSLDVDVEEVGVSLLRATAKVNRTQRGAGNGGFGGASSGAAQPTAGPADDPWATGPAVNREEPPF